MNDARRSMYESLDASSLPVIPAKAGIQAAGETCNGVSLDSRFRGNDGIGI
jgi:hypothetical protein